MWDVHKYSTSRLLWIYCILVTKTTHIAALLNLLRRFIFRRYCLREEASCFNVFIVRFICLLRDERDKLWSNDIIKQIINLYINNLMQKHGKEISYITLHFFNFLAVKHVKIFIASNVVALHLIFILIFIMCLRTKIKMYI